MCSPLLRTNRGVAGGRAAALVLAARSGIPSVQQLARSARASLDLSKDRADADWTDTWHGKHLSIADAFDAQLSGGPAGKELLVARLRVTRPAAAQGLRAAPARSLVVRLP